MVRLIIALVAISIVGCAMPGSTSRNHPPALARAESDELGDLKKAAHSASETEASSNEEHKHKRRSNDGWCPPQNNNDSNSGVLLALAAPFILPMLFLEDEYDHVTEFPDFPYSDGAKGSVLINNLDSITKQSWTGTLQAVAIPQAHDVDRFAGRLLLDTSSRFGIDTETNYWTQGLLRNGPTDQLWTGDANLVFRFAESERVQWRAGAGVNWLSDNVRTEAGFNLTYGFEWFPKRPWTIASVIDVGSLGHSGLFHNRTTIGAMVGPTELFVGYDYFELGSSKFHGPVAGLGWRF